jgi:ATP-dependent DNA helicase RecG
VAEVGDGVLVTFLLNKTVSGGASGGVSAVFEHIRMHPGVRTGELVSALGVSQRTIERWLKQLKDQQKIVFRGAAKTGGYFVQGEGP